MPALVLPASDVYSTKYSRQVVLAVEVQVAVEIPLIAKVIIVCEYAGDAAFQIGRASCRERV